MNASPGVRPPALLASVPKRVTTESLELGAEDLRWPEQLDGSAKRSSVWEFAEVACS